MITGCIEKMRAHDCGTCARRDECAFIVPELLGRLFRPAERSGGSSFLRSLFGEMAKVARKRSDRHGENSFRRRVEAELELRLAEGEIRIESVARALGCSRQTLYRRLKAEGLTFEQVLDGLRRRHALTLVRDLTLPVKEIAWRVGFSDPAAFSRAFKRWSGKSPQAFRAQPG
jgi:AraC-like DNA-binding protein